MTLTLDPDLESILNERARQNGTSLESLALNTLREKFVIPRWALGAQDEWEQKLLSVGTDCGVSLPHIALSSEGLYE